MSDETKVDPLRELAAKALAFARGAEVRSWPPGHGMRADLIAMCRAILDEKARAALSAVSAPPPDPQGWEEIERLVNALIDAEIRLRSCYPQWGATFDLHHDERSAARDRLLRALRASVSETPDVERLIRGAVDPEPELPGPMPEAMLSALRDRPEDVLRAAIRLTKAGIAERLRANASPSGPGGAAGDYSASRLLAALECAAGGDAGAAEWHTAPDSPCRKCGKPGGITYRVFGDHMDEEWRCTLCSATGYCDGPDS